MSCVTELTKNGCGINKYQRETLSVFNKRITMKNLIELTTNRSSYADKVRVLQYVCYVLKGRLHHFEGANWYIELMPRVLLYMNTGNIEHDSAIEITFDTDYFKSNKNCSTERDNEGVQIEFAKHVAWQSQNLKEKIDDGIYKLVQDS